MARTIAGELTLPDGTPLANATIHLTAKRTEATRILEDVSSSFTTSSSGAYSQEVESGYYAVSVSYAAVPGTQARRWHLGDVWVEDGDPITLTALLALNNSVADPTDAALQQMLADAQAARDEAAAAAQQAEQYRDETESMLDSKIDVSEKGEAGGVATLDSGGRVPAGQLPSYVDDVEEFADYDSLPRPGETGKIYITTDTNRQYRWGGSDYIELVASPGTTDNVPEGSSNLYHTASRVRAVTLAGISFVSSAAITASDTILSAFGKIQAKLNTLKSMAFLDKATQAQAEAGNSDSVGTTPLGVKRYVDQFGLGRSAALNLSEFTSTTPPGFYRVLSGVSGAPNGGAFIVGAYDGTPSRRGVLIDDAGGFYGASVTGSGPVVWRRQWGESNFNPDTKANRSGRVNLDSSRNITVDDLEKILAATASGVTLTLVHLGASSFMVPLVIDTSNGGTTLQAGPGMSIRWLQGGSSRIEAGFTIAPHSMVTLYQANSSEWRLAGNGIS